MSTRTRQDWILWAQLGCALVATAHAEYTLVTALGQNWIVAGAVTGALDLYVVRALQKHKDVLPAVLVMVAANVASILVGAGVVPVHWGVLAAVGALAPALVWRGHVLRVHASAEAGAVSAPALDPECAPSAVEYGAPDTVPDWMHSEYPASAPGPCALSEPLMRPLDFVCNECDYVWGAHPGVQKKRNASAPAILHSVPALPAEYVSSAEPLRPGDWESLPSAREYVKVAQPVPSVRGLMKYAKVGQDKAGRLLDYLEAEETT